MVVEAPAWALLALGLVFSFAFLWAFDKTWRATLGPAFKKLAGIGFGGVHGVGAVHPLRFLGDVNAHVEQWTADGLRSSERGIVYSINRFIDTAALLIGVPLAIALGLLELARYVVHQAGRVATRVEVHTIVRPVKTVVKVVATVTKAQLQHLTARVHALEVRVAHAGRVAGAAIASPFPRLGRLERTVKADAKRLTKVERALAVGAAAAVTLAALKRLGLGWLRCGNVTRAGKAVCGLDGNLLDALLAEALLVTGTLSLVEFAKELQAIEHEVADGVRWFLRVG